MKRSFALETLSWEHHNGLVLAFRLEQGMQFEVSSEEMKDYLLHVWQTALQVHFNTEEKHLSIKNSSEELDHLLQKMYEDHQEFNALIEKIKKSMAHDERLNLLKEFAEKLKVHIRFEERALFPEIEKQLAKADARSLGLTLHDLHQPIDLSWPNEFWKRKNGAF